MVKPIIPLDEQIKKYKNDWRFTSKNLYGKTTWNWDDAWDGQLIRDVQALQYVVDYLDFKRDIVSTYDLILGNPPFSSETDRSLAEHFVLHSLELLAPNGTLAFFLKTEFLSAEQRMNNIFKVNPPVAMIQYVPRPQFDGYQFSNTIEYAMFIWKKHSSKPTEIHWLNWKTGRYV